MQLKETLVPRRWWPHGLLVCIFLAIAAARFLDWASVGIPRCGLRTLTGFPCPLCGSTRSLVAWSHFDLISALRFNPLLFAGMLSAAAWTIVELIIGRPVPFRIDRWPRIVLLLAGAGFITHWVYLYVTLPQ